MKKLNKISAVIIIALFLINIPINTKAATTINLGAADHFAVLAGSGINNTGATSITGDMGTYPTLSQTGFGSIIQTGINHIGDIFTQTAKTDLDTAYAAAVASPSTSTIVADLGGQTLLPGVYTSASSIGITGTVTLDGGGDPNAVFIFQSGSTLTTGTSSQVSLTNSTQACNVFWQVGSSATLGTGSDFWGNILAFSSITDNSGSTVHGRLLARGAAVTLNNTTVLKATCSGLAPATINVISHTINGPSDSSDFTLSVGGSSNISPSSFSGSESGTNVTMDAGSYNIDSSIISNYNKTFSADCSGTINPGESKTCTITNTYTGSTRTSGSIPFYQNITPAKIAIGTPTPVLAIAVIDPIKQPTITVIPKLPNTGFSPQDGDIVNNIMIILGTVFLVSTSTILVLKKAKI